MSRPNRTASTETPQSLTPKLVDWLYRPAVTFLLCLTAALWIHSVGARHVGFLSDDHSFLATAAHSGWFDLIEPTHLAPLRTALFRLTAQGRIGAKTWHLIALVAHAANIALLLILLRRLGISAKATLFACLLFAFSASGLEPLIWACTHGYVLITTPLLAALCLIAGRDDAKPQRLLPWLLAILQIVALAIWDWGILLMPAAALTLWFEPGAPAPRTHSAPTPRRRLVRILRTLAPSAVVCVAYWITRRLMGCETGYQPADLARSLYYLGSAPLRGLYPAASVAFYRSAPGLVVTIALWSVLTCSALRDGRVRLLLCLFVLYQLPYIALGAPESRYFYIAGAFLYAAFASAVLRFPRQIGILVLAAVTVVAGWQATHRAMMWRAASEAADDIHTKITALAAESPSLPLVIVNLPDAFGPRDMMWRPTMWRNGFTLAGRSFTRMETPDSPLTWRDSGLPQMTRASILSAHRDHLVIEVRLAIESGVTTFTVLRLTDNGY